MRAVHRVVSAALCACLLIAGTITAARAGSDPDRRWFSIVTPHFAVHSHDGGEDFARAVAGYCEEARTLVGDLLDWRPNVRVHVLAVDDFDAANGFASVLPFPSMTIWAWPPPPETELGHYGNWLRLLVLHEYTHIAHLDAAGGIPEGVNTLFGRIWKPNNATPRWVSEGLAVWIESRFGARTGRVGSHGTETYFRTSALAGRLPTLDELTGSPLEHPRGASWYFYGGALFEHIARHAGDDAVRRFVHQYGSWPPPYALNTIARDATGKTLVAWFDELRADIRRRAAATAARVQATGERRGEILRGPLDALDAPRFTPDGRHLLWLESDGDEPTRLVSAPAPAPAAALAAPPFGRLFHPIDPSPLIRCEGGCGRFHPTRDGTRVLLATARDYRRSSFNSYLAVIPFTPDQTLERRAPRLLAGSRRAYDPAPAADGGSVWAALTVWGVSSLARFSLATGEVLERIELPPNLTRPGSHARIDRPVATADGRALYASIHAAGNRDLYRIDLVDKRFTALAHGAAEEMDPALSSDQRWLLFSSDRDGVFNVYALGLQDGVTRQVTNVLSGATQPTLSPDGRILVYRGWTVDGPTLEALPFDPEHLPEVPLDDTSPRASVTPLTTRAARYPYHPLPTLLPRSWLPSLTASSSGPPILGLSAEATDATGRYGLVLSADWSFDRADWTAFASLFLATAYPDLAFQLGRYSWDRESFVGDVVEDYREEVVYASASIALPFPDVFAGLSWGLGVNADLARGLDVGRLEHTPDETSAIIPEERLRTSYNLFFSFSDLRQHALAIAPSEGLSAFFNLSLREPALGGDGSAFTFTFVTHAHVPLPPVGHVLSFRLGGGLAGGDRDARSVFSLGGVPRQDLLTDLLNQTAAGAVWLRGFDEAAFQGTRFALLTGEWRFPLVRVRSGLSTLPLFFEDLSVAVFSDVGGATFEEDLGGALVAGAGVELRFRLELFFGALYDFRLGYAHGFGDHGGDHVYFLMAGAP